MFFIILLMLFVLWTVPSWAANRFVSPSGSGSTCSTGTPCSVATGLSQGVAGDHIIFKNGTYATTLITVRAGSPGLPITIRAENTLQAIITPPVGWTPANLNVSPITYGDAQYVRIHHSHTTLRGLLLDAEDRSFATLRVARPSTTVPSITNIIVEDMKLRDAQGSHFNLNSTTNILIRHNVFESVIRTEPWYITSQQAVLGAVQNLEAYGNLIQDGGSNLMDFKRGVLNANIHHNILEGQYNGGIVALDGIITVEGQGIHIHNNIIRNSLSQTAVFDYVQVWDNHNIHNNVAYNITAPEILWYQTNSAPVAASKFQNNTFCNTPSDILLRHTGGSSQSPAGLTQSGNLFNQAQGVCDLEVTRIVNETADLPREGVLETINPPTSLAVVSITN